MPLGDNASICTTLRRFNGLADLGREQLARLAQQVEVLYAPQNTRLLELGDQDTRLLFLLEGALELFAADGAVRIIRDTDPAAREPVSRLRPSRYCITSISDVTYLLIEQAALDSRSSAGGYVVVEETYPGGDPDGLADHRGAHPLMAEIFDNIHYGRVIVPSDPEAAIRVGRSLNPGATDTDHLARILSVCPALSLKIVRAAMAMGARNVPVRSCKDALARLGTRRAFDLTVNCVLRESLRTDSRIIRERMRSWSQRTVRVAAISATLARMSERFNPEYAALIGLLHSIAEPVLLGYADRYPELADPEALDTVVHDNRAELGRVLLSIWDLPKEIVDAAARCNQWGYDHAGEADYTDIVLAAQWHATIGGSWKRRPAAFELPALQRLGLNPSAPDLSHKIVEAADDALWEVHALLA